MKALLEADARADWHNELGYTPLMMAVQEKYTDCALLLLNAGAQRDAVSSEGINALFFAEAYEHEDCVRLLKNNE